MSQSPKTFDDFRIAMERNWKDKVISSSSLEHNSARFYCKHIQDYSINRLFVEHLDLQIHLSQKQKAFTFIYPIQAEDCFSILSKRFKDFNQKNKIIELIASTTSEGTKNIINFLTEKTEYDYIFWNVTFPNIFLGFISDEYCEKAASFLDQFKDNEEFFSKGVLSFISHNYYFQDSFMKSYFIYSQEENHEEDSEENFGDHIQNSLKKAFEKLTIQQLDALEILYEKYPKKAMEMFLDNVIISNIKLWKYSPLFSPSQINGDGEKELLDYIDNHFKKDDGHEENLENLLKPVFEDVFKNKITMNKIEIKRIIFNEAHNIVLTFLDILILLKLQDNPTSEQIGPILDKFDVQKAFYYIIFNKNETEPEDMRKECKIPDKIEFDKGKETKWNKIKEYKENHNENPLEVFYNEEELRKLLDEDPQLALTGIGKSYYEWLEYKKTKDKLKRESRVIILLKAILESQKSYMEMISTYYSITFSISHDNFANNLKGLFQNVMKNVVLEYVKLRLEKIYQNMNEAHFKVINEINKEIENELSKNFDTYFDIKTGANKLHEFAVNEINNMYKYLEINDKVPSLTESFDKYIDFMKYLTRAYLISYYKDAKINVDESQFQIDNIEEESQFQIDNIEDESNLNNRFSLCASSGVFNYINDFVTSLERSVNDSKISIGHIFAAVPVINKFLKQFVASNNTKTLMNENYIDEKTLAKSVFYYAFNENFEEKINDFAKFILTASNELHTFKNGFPYIQELNNEFEFLKKYL